MFVDSHCHLDRLSDKTHGGDVAATLAAARAAHVNQFLAVAVNLDDMPTLAALSREHHDVAISAGLHPLHTPVTEPDADTIGAAATRYGAVAIGETGLDYHYRESVPAEVQHARFEQHLIAARELELPVIVHTREAREDTLALLEKHVDPRVGGVLHCFTEDIDMARRAVGLGFYISLSGIVTFASATALRELARKLPLDRMLIETDSPYLAPVPHRGTQP
ncbi:MAG: TatD family hydrolase, partial [Halomonadaceae bacterium]